MDRSEQQFRTRAVTIRWAIRWVMCVLLLVVASCATSPDDVVAVESLDAATTGFDEPPGDDAATAEGSASAESGNEVASTDAGISLGAGASWQWQLQGDLDTSFDVDVYDIDLFDTPADQIGALRRQGRVVICYFSAGSVEDWRPDASEFPQAGIGEPLDGWEGENWLDVTSNDVRAVLAARLDLAVAKGCHGVEPDNVTAANNRTGFDISPAEQLDFNLFLADEAHRRGLLVGLKNNLEQIPDLVDHVDFAVNEQCLEYDECDVYGPFVAAGKPIFSAEYAHDLVEDPAGTCAAATEFGLSTLLLDVDLDNSLRIEC